MKKPPHCRFMKACTMDATPPKMSSQPSMTTEKIVIKNASPRAIIPRMICTIPSAKNQPQLRWTTSKPTIDRIGPNLGLMASSRSRLRKMVGPDGPLRKTRTEHSSDCDRQMSAQSAFIEKQGPKLRPQFIMVLNDRASAE